MKERQTKRRKGKHAFISERERKRERERRYTNCVIKINCKKLNVVSKRKSRIFIQLNLENTPGETK